MLKCLKNGFTLVELIIVIGIFGFLTALLVPSLGRAKDRSKLIICRSNLRSLALGCLAYASENHSRLPVDRQLHNTHTDLIEKLYDGGYIQDSKMFFQHQLK